MINQQPFREKILINKHFFSNKRKQVHVIYSHTVKMHFLICQVHRLLKTGLKLFPWQQEMSVLTFPMQSIILPLQLSCCQKICRRHYRI